LVDRAGAGLGAADRAGNNASIFEYDNIAIGQLQQLDLYDSRPARAFCG